MMQPRSLFIVITRISPGVFEIFSLYLLVALSFFGSSMAIDPGLGWHLRTGQWILDHLEVMRHDPFLFTTAGRAWVSDQWLADVILWLVYRLGGFPLLHAVTIILCVMPFALLLGPLLRNERRATLLALLLLFLSALCASVQWTIRPVVFSFMFFSFLYCWLALRFGKSNLKWVGKSDFIVPLLFVLWANCHPAFVLGFLLIGLWLAAGTLNCIRGSGDRKRLLRLVLLLLLSVLGSLITPYGLALYRSIFSLASSSYFMRMNDEWLPPEFGQTAFIPFYVSGFLVLLFLVFRGWRFVPAKYWLPALVFFLLSCFQRRYIPFWGLSFVYPAFLFLSALGASSLCLRSVLLRRLALHSAALALYDERRSAIVQPVIFSMLLIYMTAVFGSLPGRPPGESSFSGGFPLGVVEVLRGLSPRASARIFHSPNLGGFLIWSVFPKWKIFIDDRNVLCGKDLYEDYFVASSGRDWQGVFSRYGFELALLPASGPRSLGLEMDNRWQMVWEGEGFRLFQEVLSD